MQLFELVVGWPMGVAVLQTPGQVAAVSQESPDAHSEGP